MDFFVGFFFAFPSAFLICLAICYFFVKRNDSDISYDLTVIKEDLANLQVKLSGFLTHV